MESNQINHYSDLKGKKNYYRSDDKYKKQQKDKHEGILKGHQNHKIWGKKVRKFRLFV